MSWRQKRSFWVAVCVVLGLVVAWFGHHTFSTVVGCLFVALGVIVALVRD